MAQLILQSKGTTGGDTLIESNDVNANFGGASSLRAGINGAIIAKSLIRFDLSSLPAGAVVQSAFLTLHCIGQDSATARGIAVTRGLTQWYEGSLAYDLNPGGNASTWSKRNFAFNFSWTGSVAGGQAGGDYVSTPSSGTVSVNTVGADYTWTVTSDVQLWVAGTTNNGFWVLASTADTDSRKHFSSFDATTPSERPKLVINYTVSQSVTPAPVNARGSTQGIAYENLATVVIQPDGTAGKDTTLSQAAPTLNYGVTPTLYSGVNSAANTYKTLIQFDLSSVPASSPVGLATLSLWVEFQDSAAAQSFTVRRGLVAWFEGAKDAAAPDAAQDGSTWNLRNANGSLAWAAAGGFAGTDYLAVANATDTQTVPAGTGFWVNFDVTADVAAYIAGTATNFGWWVLSTSGASNTRKGFSSAETLTAAQRPKLTVYYGTPVYPSATAAPTPATSVSSTTSDPVTIAVQVNPTPDSGVGTTVVGTVVKSGIVVSPTVDRVVGTTTGPTAVIKGGLAITPSAAAAVGAMGGFASLVNLSLIPAAASARASTTGRVVAMRIFPQLCDPRPLLYLTDGTFKNNGQPDLLSFIDRNNGFILSSWDPTVAQFKEGGIFSDSPSAEGRSLSRASYENAIETFELTLKGHSQDSAIQFLTDLFDWRQRSVGYWTADWGTRPVYLVKRAAKETNTLYAPVKMIQIPALKNPYNQPFFSRDGKPRMEQLQVMVERGHWLSSPPGEGECVAVSSTRSWTVAGWQASNTTAVGGVGTAIDGNVISLFQAKNGDILAGTDNQAKVYRSTDNGATWFFVNKFGSANGTDRVNAFTMDYQGNLYAAVEGLSPTLGGVWKSTNNGTSWTKVKSHTSGSGYRDIAYVKSNGTIVAVGYAAATSNLSGITMSWDAGVTWTSPVPVHWGYNALAVAAPDLPGLFTELPGISPTGPEAFFGFDSNYTIAGRAGRSNNGFVKETSSGPMGQAGLDMASYGYKQANGSLNRRALWAVKSAADATDTEIWQWPNPVGATDTFGKIATIDNKIFNVLYVDPTPDYNSTQRTVWAGANGEVYVSYNSGYTWSLATTAPVNQIRSFVRTTAGTLLAGGDSGEIFVFAGTAKTEGGGVGVGVPIVGGSIVNSHQLGREATCDDEVYISNKSSFSNVTHVYYYTNSTYNELQFATEPPYALLGTNPSAGKATYFGSQTSDPNVPGGPFTSLVFDITQIGQNFTIGWEYWNGTTWSALTTEDNTNGYRVLGVNSVHWTVPSNWTTTAVNGITGYWVRSRIIGSPTGTVGPIHSNRYIYTVNLPFVEVDEGEISGDLPANGQIRWHNQADDQGTSMDLEVDRIVCGLRSMTRGDYFNAYLNISDVQVPFGFSLAVTTEGAWVDSKRAPTARALQITSTTPGLNTWNDLTTFSIANSVARDYYGTFRAFLRCYKNGATAKDWQIRVRVSFGSGGASADTNPVFPSVQKDWEILDLGQISIPSTQVSQVSGNQGDLLKIIVQGKCSLLASVLNLYDVVLIPVDEWAVDAKAPILTTSNTVKVKGDDFMDIDSITNPKNSIAVYNRNSADQIVSRYQAVNNGPVQLQKETRQRLWFLTMSHEGFWRSYPESAGSVTVKKQQKYLGMRGRN